MEWIFIVAILLFSVIFHEVSHGTMANSLGDPTAKNAGRLTLNPIPHLDPIGSILLPAFLVLINTLTPGTGIIFGWAKPVPVNPFNFRDKKYGELKVAIIGPLANLSLALVFGLILRFFFPFLQELNLVFLISYIVFINIILAVFNLLPIPPLDGSHILFTLLPDSMRSIKVFLYQFGLPLLFLVIFFLLGFLSFIADFIFKLIVGGSIGMFLI